MVGHICITAKVFDIAHEGGLWNTVERVLDSVERALSASGAQQHRDTWCGIPGSDILAQTDGVRAAFLVLIVLFARYDGQQFGPNMPRI